MAWEHVLKFQGPPSKFSPANVLRSNRFIQDLHDSHGASVCNGYTRVHQSRVRRCNNEPVIVDALGDGWCGTHMASAVVCNGCFGRVGNERCLCDVKNP